MMFLIKKKKRKSRALFMQAMKLCTEIEWFSLIRLTMNLLLKI